MTPLEIQLLAQTFSDVYEKIEYDLMINTIKNISTHKEIAATAEWQIKKLAQLGKLNKENIAIMSKALKGVDKDINKMLTDISLKTAANLEPGYAEMVKDGILKGATPIEKSASIQQIVKEVQKQVKQSLNLTNTTMLSKAKSGYVNLVNATSSKAIEILNKSTLEVITGAESRQTALCSTIKEFNDNGIAGFVDKLGRNWTPEAYTNMVLRTSVSNTANGVQLARADDYEIDYVEVSSHSGARPKCAKDQGKVFCKSGKDKKYPAWSTSSYGKSDGLLGINCGHSIYPFIPGVSIQRYLPVPEEENEEQYNAIQGQRAIERDIRKSKREKALYDEVGDIEGSKMAQQAIKDKQAKIRQYVSENDLPRRNNREQIG